MSAYFTSLREFFERKSKEKRNCCNGRVFYCRCYEPSHKIVVTFMGSERDIFSEDDICIEYPMLGRATLPCNLIQFEKDYVPLSFIKYHHVSYREGEDSVKELSSLKAVCNILTAVLKNTPAVIEIYNNKTFYVERILDSPSDMLYHVLKFTKSFLPLCSVLFYRFFNGLKGDITFCHETLLSIEDFEELSMYDPDLKMEIDKEINDVVLTSDINTKEISCRLKLSDRIKLALSGRVYGLYFKSIYDGEIIKEVRIIE